MPCSSVRVATPLLLVSVSFLFACSAGGANSADKSRQDAATGSGGQSATGGTSVTGGNTSTAGSTGSGGMIGTGGSTASGGVTTTGGRTGSGGTTSSGGLTGPGGTTAAGGTIATGGLTGAGATTAAGGATATGGVTGTAGRTGTAGSVAVGSGGLPATGGTASGGTATGGSSSARGGTGGLATATTGTGGVSTGGSTGYNPCPTNGSACKIMPFGDSITDGYGVPGGYRIELFTLAHQAGKKITFVGSSTNGPATVDGVAFPQHHEGHSGYTIDPTPSRSGISPLVATVMPQNTPHIITLMIGTNDAIDNYQMSAAPTRLGTLIDSIFTQLPDVLLVVAQIVPSQDDALNGRIQTYNAAIPAVVKTRADAGRHILLVDMYPVLANTATYKTTLLADTWHPNSAGYALMGQAWYDVLESFLP
jgi:lysophospholipase L1-like esterase